MPKIGVSFGGGMPLSEIVDCARVADQLGYDSVWMTEGNGGDPFSILTACALATENVRLGTDITSVYVRSAPIIAMSAASVDHFSNGRFILGLGSSHRVQVIGQHGLTYTKPLSRVREYVEIIRRLFRDGSVSYEGRLFQIENFSFSFDPIRSEIPVFLAAVYPKMLRLCGETAQGVILTQNTPEKAKEAAQHVAAAAAEAGRDPGQIEIASLITCDATPDAALARQEVRHSLAYACGFYPRYSRFIGESGFQEEAAAIRAAWLAGDRDKAVRLVPDRMIDALTIIGTPEQIASRLDEHRAAGVTLPILTFRPGMENAKARILETISACAPA